MTSLLLLLLKAIILHQQRLRIFRLQLYTLVEFAESPCRFPVCWIFICQDFTQTLREWWTDEVSHFFQSFQIDKKKKKRKKNRNKSDPADSSGPHVGGSGCRGYVYLQIKPSVPKQYLPGLFRYTSAVKPWVQPSLYCVNLPSFSRDSISFLPPPNTPIHAPHSLCTRANKRDVAIDGGGVAGNKCLCSGSVSPRPPRSFCVTNLERAQRGDDAKFRWEEMQEEPSADRRTR